MKIIDTPNQLTDKAKSVEKVWDVPNAKMIMIQLRAGEEVAEHDSDKEVLIIVRSGSVIFTVDGTPVTVTPGNVLHMSPFEKHSLTAETDVTICVLQITP